MLCGRFSFSVFFFFSISVLGSGFLVLAWNWSFSPLGSVLGIWVDVGFGFVFQFSGPLKGGWMRSAASGRKISCWRSFAQTMAPGTNWLSFSLSPIEMLRSSESQMMPYESSSAASPHYFVDNFYANGIPIFFFYYKLETLSPAWLLRKCDKTPTQNLR